jgi:two-component system, LuxR family, response regulator FixJ
MSPGSRVYIVDDQEAVRDSLQLLLASLGYAVRSFASARAFLRAAPSLAPGCLISDVRMPGMDGIELQNHVAKSRLAFTVILMTGHGDIPMAVRAMRSGAVDFIEKPFSEQAIIESVGHALSRLRAHGSDARDVGPEILRRFALLSPREREVLEGLVEGLPNKTIAYDLNISPRTVEIHRARVMGKMKARSISELVRLVLAAEIERKGG